MFSEEFFPTPAKIIGKMLEPFLKPKYEKSESNTRSNYRRLLDDMIILEPQAGKGDILDYITGQSRNVDVYAIEKDPNLKHILHGKGYKVIADDFLQYTGDLQFDLIIMNPPFSNAVDHILKAWDLIDEGHVISLINTSNLINTQSEKRQFLAKLISLHGSREDIGPVFMTSRGYVKKGMYGRDDEIPENDGTAERTSNVHCSIIRLEKKPADTKFDFEFKEVNKSREFNITEDVFKDPVATRDIVGNMILQFDKLKEQFIEYMKIAEGINYYGQGLTSESQSAFQYAIASYGNPLNKRIQKKAAFNNFNEKVKGDIWLQVIRKTKVEKYMTHSVRQNFQQFCKHQGFMDFTKENVASIVQMIFENRYQILEKAIVEVFDLFTSHHKDNRYLITGWKTNDKWKVNRKVILPHAVKLSWETKERLRWGAEYLLSYYKESEYSDIDKVMCYLTATNMSSDAFTSITEALRYAFQSIGKIFRGPHQHSCQSTFFDIKFYMKGTMHLTFRDEHLWEEFNMRACADKKWLPEQEEKAWRKKKEKPADHCFTYEPQLKLEKSTDDADYSLF